MPADDKPLPEVKGFLRKVCIIQGRLEGKIIIVTGANTGIGKITTAELARRGAHVIMACRSKERAEEAKKWIVDTYGVANPNYLKTDLADPSVESSLSAVTSEQLQIELLDLASLKSVREFASRINQQYDHLNFLINNAGLAMQNYQTTEDGYERTIAVNYLGPFLLTELLLPLLRKGAPSRIINVASKAHLMGELHKPNLQIPPDQYGLISAYSQSKLANVIHARELSKRLKDCGVTAVSLHPGVIKTEIDRDMTGVKGTLIRLVSAPLYITPWLGTQTTLYTVLTPNLTAGAYYDNCKETRLAARVLDDAKGDWLWNTSCKLVGLTTETDDPIGCNN